MSDLYVHKEQWDNKLYSFIDSLISTQSQTFSSLLPKQECRNTQKINTKENILIRSQLRNLSI